MIQEVRQMAYFLSQSMIQELCQVAFFLLMKVCWEVCQMDHYPGVWMMQGVCQMAHSLVIERGHLTPAHGRGDCQMAFPPEVWWMMSHLPHQSHLGHVGSSFAWNVRP